MAEVLRDDALIVNLQTFRDFMDVTEVFNNLFTPRWSALIKYGMSIARQSRMCYTSFRAMGVEGT
jgi:hypothetical protein